MRSLLDADASQPSFLEWSVPEETAVAADARVRRREGDLIGREVGNYRITRFIAAGGMGAVYEAQQRQPRRIVAMKFLRAAWVTPSAHNRFEMETEALARMKHPGVAQIFDAGTIDDAMGPLLYFAMEHIADAKTLINYARERNLSQAQRLELFAQVCDAVHHGHQRGIIHRDLKPANILIDAGGQPKVIDFGVARWPTATSNSRAPPRRSSARWRTCRPSNSKPRAMRMTSTRAAMCTRSASSSTNCSAIDCPARSPVCRCRRSSSASASRPRASEFDQREHLRRTRRRHAQGPGEAAAASLSVGG